eukprot:s2122_g26.t1
MLEPTVRRVAAWPQGVRRSQELLQLYFASHERLVLQILCTVVELSQDRWMLRASRERVTLLLFRLSIRACTALD